MSTVEISGLVKNFGAFQALKSIDLSIGDGEFVVMVGPSGCGKSTLLRAIAGLEMPDDGMIMVGDRDVTFEEPADRGVAMVFQNYALYPHMTVAGNMGFGLKMAGIAKDAIADAVQRASDILSIGDHLHKQPKALSGGQKQRVAIGRAITRQPKVFLFDEPLSNLDAALRTRMRVELGRLHNELNATMIYVTHDQTEAMTMADRIVVLSSGAIEQVGSPRDLYNRPGNLFVAGFLGSPKMNVLQATLVSATDGELTASVAGLPDITRPLDVTEGRELAVGDKVLLGIRPEALGEGDISFNLKARVVENLGRETLIYGTPENFRSCDGDAEDGDIVVQYPRQYDAAAGQTLTVGMPLDAFYIFDSDGRTRSFAAAH
ncbi:carbohydrate ABC transporter ATP-binding protein (CUT1 family) [Aliiruegeria haliotis]|uniref:Carbohydrate ABC transporter ATP-binding protein (CUT1 family) n=1 Tax=Aliiruegeria haliotis TaxID=1280846 RepID=A0A2T0RM31_9RHOB|nr:sn-glycerol-3-phosphate ABC transporter ATP-binding protein UgpC [Aliiruegeria haliotis]PRY22173.1 carbohydrate ABC transporter ATP-binding protein (CUT1 family) [Aliiruegeria haliotis]